MKSIRKYVLITSAVLLFFSSCTLEKRIYRKGYHVDWRKPVQDQASDVISDEVSTEESNQKILINSKSPMLVNQQSTAQLEYNVDDDMMASIASVLVTTSDKRNQPTVDHHSTMLAKQKELVEKLTSHNLKRKSLKIDAEQSTAVENGKSQLVALLLCIFLGGLGIHRFYLGYPGIGVLMLLTAGVCGILALVDLIRIITGDLKPKNGEYTEKL